MASITIRNLDDRVKDELRLRAARHGRSIQEEIRLVLRNAVAHSGSSEPTDLADLALAIFGPEHGVDLPPVPRPNPRTLPGLPK